ncbi:MAG: hypothetical protein J0L97_03235 [Alphaproteobacteria bacterium]|nr:hypothetical protein [Alphaproteobacteria bacterium]
MLLPFLVPGLIYLAVTVFSITIGIVGFILFSFVAFPSYGLFCLVVLFLSAKKEDAWLRRIIWLAPLLHAPIFFLQVVIWYVIKFSSKQDFIELLGGAIFAGLVWSAFSIIVACIYVLLVKGMAYVLHKKDGY